jgi:rRNA maturation endonuclease Nob1
MNKYEYRCNRCLIIEERWLFNNEKPRNTTFCQKCGGLAIRHPFKKWKNKVFEDFASKV